MKRHYEQNRNEQLQTEHLHQQLQRSDDDRGQPTLVEVATATAMLGRGPAEESAATTNGRETGAANRTLSSFTDPESLSQHHHGIVERIDTTASMVINNNLTENILNSVLPSSPAAHHGGDSSNATSSNNGERDLVLVVQERQQNCYYMVMAMISNLSTSYNAVNVSIVLPILRHIILSSTHPTNAATTNTTAVPARTSPSSTPSPALLADEAVVASTLLAGMMIGQILGGLLADNRSIGPLYALQCMMFIQIVASLGSAFLVGLPESSSSSPPMVAVVEQTPTHYYYDDPFDPFHHLVTNTTTTNSLMATHNSIIEESIRSVPVMATIEGIMDFGTFIIAYCGFNTTAAVATIGSPTGTNHATYMSLAGWRFLLGIGAGGVYPLAAVLSAGGEGRRRERSLGQQQRPSSWRHHPSTLTTTMNPTQRVVMTFSTQGLGFLIVPLVAVLFLHTCHTLHWVYRLMLAFGCIPGVVLLLLQQWITHNYSFRHCQQQQYTTTITQPPVDNDQPVVGVLPPTNELEEGSVSYDDFLDSMQDMEPLLLADDNQIMDVNHIIMTNNDHQIHHETAPHVISSTGRSTNDVHDDTVVTDDNDLNNENNNMTLWTAIRLEENLIQKLLGTALTWFLFDVLFYGNTLFQPIVIEAAFGGNGGNHNSDDNSSNNNNSRKDWVTLQSMALDSLVLTMIALPGYLVSIFVIDKSIYGIIQSPRYVMMQGFAIMSLLYLCIGFYWTLLRHAPNLLLFLYGCTFFFANYGPNTTTFILPSLMYSMKCRATLNGLCAAMGKLGALVGASFFGPLTETYGDPFVMILCAMIALLAFFLTQCFVIA